MIKETIISWSTAFGLVEKGFNMATEEQYTSGESIGKVPEEERDLPFFKWEDSKLPAVSQSIVQKWFRDKCSIDMFVRPIKTKKEWVFEYWVSRRDSFTVSRYGDCKTYEEALEWAITVATTFLPEPE